MHDKIPPKLEAVLARLIEKLGPIYKTQAVKLPYLVDVVANRVLGRPITGATHEAWRRGVVTIEAYHGIGRDRLFRVQDIDFTESTQKVALAGTGTPPPLTKEEQDVVDAVAETFGRYTPTKLGTLTKRMNPELSAAKWGSNTQARLDDEAYIHMGPAYQRFLDKLEKCNLDDRSQWVEITDDEAFVRDLFNA